MSKNKYAEIKQYTVQYAFLYSNHLPAFCW